MLNFFRTCVSFSAANYTYNADLHTQCAFIMIKASLQISHYASNAATSDLRTGDAPQTLSHIFWVRHFRLAVSTVWLRLVCRCRRRRRRRCMHVAAVKVSASAATDLPSVNALSCIVSLILSAPFIARFKSSVEFIVVLPVILDRE